MSSWVERGLLAATLLGAVLAASAQAPASPQTPAPPWAQMGRAATAAEIRAWDIDVRPDFRGLPKGSGSVARGQVVWEAQCASCHGIFGESNEIFTPLIGGTTADDVRTGRVARLRDEGFPQRTSMMKLSTLSTLWDYVYRAMPWTQPKSLSHDDVYAVVAYMLNLASVVDDNFVLSDANVRDTQARLPARLGKTTAHALWPGRGLAGTLVRPDVQGIACMRECKADTTVASSIPEHARNAHGNLAEQNRLVGPQRGADTTRPFLAVAATPGATAGTTASAPVAPAPRSTTPATGAAPAAGLPAPDARLQALLSQHQCLACHGLNNRVVGPSLREVAAKYAARPDAEAYLASRITQGAAGVWGAIPMPGQNLPAADLRAIVQWMARTAP
jgi:S-disulfanyl-L-cysteine oxidoreductase SoxD